MSRNKKISNNNKIRAQLKNQIIKIVVVIFIEMDFETFSNFLFLLIKY